jgi:putative ABC transport system permease protein
MPDGFSLGEGEQLWVPLDVSRTLADHNRARKFHYLYGIGRLKPGVTLAAANADLNTIARRLEREYPDANTGHMVSAIDIRTAMSGDLRPTMILLSSAAALVLLIACANLANLIVARGVSRRRELAVRAALGAGRARLARQMMTETILLALAGGATAIVVAAWGTRALLSINPEALPPFANVGVDARMLMFAAAAAAISGLLAGLLPSFAVTRVDLNETLKASSRTGAGVARGDRIRRGLVIAQTALAVVLLIGSGLLIRSLRAVERVQRGFDSSNVMTATVTVHGGRYDSLLVINSFYSRVMSAMRTSPAVANVGGVGGLPLRGGSSASLAIEGVAEAEGRLPEVGYIPVAGDYFQTLRIPLLRGRFFDASDGPNGPGAIIINDALARTYFAGRDPIGQRIRLGPNPKDPYIAIVGVVGDVRQSGLERDVRPTAFVNNERDGWSSLTVVARGTRDAASTLPVLRDAVRGADPTALIDQVSTMDDVVGASLSRRRFALVLLSIFAGVSLCLAALGVYGVLAYAVAARRREFGLRLALGAETSQVIALVLRQGLGWAATGVALGVLGARAATRVIAGEVFGITAADPWTYAAVSAVVVATALIACFLPVRRATQVDPATSLRED